MKHTVLPLNELLKIHSGLARIIHCVANFGYEGYDLSKYDGNPLGMHYRANCFNWKEVTEHMFGFEMPMHRISEQFKALQGVQQKVTALFMGNPNIENCEVTRKHWLKSARNVLEHIELIIHCDENPDKNLTEIYFEDKIKEFSKVVHRMISHE